MITDRERAILRMVHGYESSHDAMTQAEVAEAVGLSQQRVAQILEDIYARVRSSGGAILEL
jgi:DNA-directed RNA polymerase sigma subunit (sigma70/sigma32)